MDIFTLIFLVIVGAALIFAVAAFRFNARMTSGHIEPAETVQKIRETGIPAKAEILNVWETGIVIQNNTRLRLRLRVTRPDHPPYEVETETLATPLQLSKLHPGNSIPLYIDPNNPQNVAL